MPRVLVLRVAPMNVMRFLEVTLLRCLKLREFSPYFSQCKGKDYIGFHLFLVKLFVYFCSCHLCLEQNMSATNTEEVKDQELSDSTPKNQDHGDNAEEDLKASDETHGVNPMPSAQEEVQYCSIF